MKEDFIEPSEGYYYLPQFCEKNNPVPFSFSLLSYYGLSDFTLKTNTKC